MATPAERQRRYRRHVKGDHSLCDPERCGGETPAEPQATTADYEARQERGARLWAEMSEGLGPLQRVLLEEACRIADRLDRLDAMLAGRQDWIRLRSRDEDGTTFVVVVDGLLAESRQQAMALRGLVAELRAAAAKTSKSAQSKAKGAGVADLSSRIAARRGAASG